MTDLRNIEKKFKKFFVNILFKKYLKLFLNVTLSSKQTLTVDFRQWEGNILWRNFAASEGLAIVMFSYLLI